MVRVTIEYPGTFNGRPSPNTIRKYFDTKEEAQEFARMYRKWLREDGHTQITTTYKTLYL